MIGCDVRAQLHCRLVGTSIDGEWSFSQAAINSRPDFEALNKEVMDTLIDEFAGPADKGVYR